MYFILWDWKHYSKMESIYFIRLPKESSSNEWRISVSVLHWWAKIRHNTVNLHFYCAPSSVSQELGRACLHSLRPSVLTWSSQPPWSASSVPTGGFRWPWPWFTSLWRLYERPRARVPNGPLPHSWPRNYKDNMWLVFSFFWRGWINIWYDYCFKH